MKVLCDFQWQVDNICSKETPDWKALEAAKALTSLVFCHLVQYQGKVPGENAPLIFGSVSVETIQETGEILIFADINGEVSQLVSNCSSVTINGSLLQLPFLEQVQKEVSYGFQRWCPEVYLFTEAPLCQNGPLYLTDRPS